MVTAYQQSREEEILTAEPAELVRLLLEGAAQAACDARQSLLDDDPVARSRFVSKAQAILVELAISLDHVQGGDLSRRLAELYDYLQRRLAMAHATGDGAAFDEVERLLRTLEEGWRSSQPAW